MKSINYVIVVDYQIASELGKKGTTTDLSIYGRKTQDTIYTWVVPITFPDKIQSLILGTNIAEYAEYAILDNIDQLKQQLSGLEPNSREGECIIPIDHSFNVKGVGTVVLGV